MTSLRIVTINVGSLLESEWDDRRHEVVAWIDHYDPDVVCLQEVWETSESPNTGSWIAEACAADWHVESGGGPFDESLWPDQTMRFGSAILSRWPIDDANYHRLGIDQDQVEEGSFVARVPWELFHVSTAGLDIYSTHLVSAPSDLLHRHVQVVEIDKIIKESRGTKDDMVRFGKRRQHMPPILCGDFNAEPDSDEIRFLSGLTPLKGATTFYQDAWKVAGDGGPGYTQDWRTMPHAARLNVHRKRIDYVFVGDGFLREGDSGRVLSAEVGFDRSLTGDVIASDHCGLCVDVVWSSRPS